MYTVLLVDDEEKIMEVMKVRIGWQELGVDKLLTASDGQAALEYFEQQRIDLLVTDIRMPRMDGLELIEKVRSLYPDTHCILLTAYGEFEYARRAIQLGVENYLLKPVADVEMEQTIQKALDNIYNSRKNSRDLLRENTLNRWASGSIGSEELSERAAVLGINLYQPEYCVVCAVRRGKSSLAAFRASCLELLAQKYEVNGFWDEKGRWVMILGGRDLSRENVSAEISHAAQESGAVDAVRVAIGTSVKETDLLHMSYLNACDTIDMNDLSDSPVLLQEETDTLGIDADLLAEEIRILYYLPDQSIRDTGYRHLAMKLYQQDGKETPLKSLSRLHKGCLRVLMSEFPAQENLREVLRVPTWTPEKQHSESDFARAAEEMLVTGRQAFMKCLAELSPIVQVALRYVHDSVMEGAGISIKDFCAKNGMNPAYLGHLFKKETGTFFNDYLMQCRINQSIILLRNPNRKIKDIAEEVGFASASYYVKCFRENKGISPSRYRMGLHMNEG